MRLAVLLAGSLGCSEAWDLDQPIALSVDTVNLDQAEWRAAFADFVRQLAPQAQIENEAAQTIHVAWDDRCGCASCTPYTVAHTERPNVAWGLQDTVQVCPWFLAEPAKDRVYDTLGHELGRVFGFYGYLPCESGAMMTQYFNCRSDHRMYKAADVEAMRETGKVVGGVFNQP